MLEICISGFDLIKLAHLVSDLEGMKLPASSAECG